jgi:hypothetical protein
MPLASGVCSRLGARVVVATSALALIVTLPLLTILTTPAALSVCLVVFGAAIGAIDMAANLHGMEVQSVAGMPLMSGFHGMFSLGALIGASGMAGIVAWGLAPQTAALVASGSILACGLGAFPGFLVRQARDRLSTVVMPRGSVIVLGVLLFMTFLTQGVMLDWSAVLLAQYKHVAIADAGAGYAAFAVAMVSSRLIGDALVARYGERAMLMVGFVITGAGIGLVAGGTTYLWVMLGTVISGLAVGNIGPALFHLAARQRVMPIPHATAAVTMMGYLGGLVGPVLIGPAAHWLDQGLVMAFYGMALVIAAMALLVPGALAWTWTPSPHMPSGESSFH